MIVQDSARWQELYGSRWEYEQAVKEACGFIATFDPDSPLSRAVARTYAPAWRDAARQAQQLFLMIGQIVGWLGDGRDLLNLVVDYTYGRASVCDLARCSQDLILRCQEQLAIVEQCVNWRSYKRRQEKTKRLPCPCSRIP